MDIVERLRTQPPRDLSGLTHDLREDAAKEIEALRSMLLRGFQLCGKLQWAKDGVIGELAVMGWMTKVEEKLAPIQDTIRNEE